MSFHMAERLSMVIQIMREDKGKYLLIFVVVTYCLINTQ